MKKMTWMRGTMALALVAAASTALGADHLDGPAVAADSTADITDVYSWLDGSNVVLVMNVSPLATTASKFSDKVQYVFHTESTSAFGMAGTKVDVICTFDAAQKISCWVGDKAYVTGDASATAGLEAADKSFKVFAGLRDDPFFFNLDGFKDTVATVDAAAAGLTFDAAGCPALDAATSAALVAKLKTDPNSTPPGGVAKDFFAGKNVLSIVLSVDKKLLNGGGPLLNVWGSTNKGG